MITLSIAAIKLEIMDLIERLCSQEMSLMVILAMATPLFFKRVFNWKWKWLGMYIFGV